MKAPTRRGRRARRKVLVISHSAVAKPYQEKWRLLSALGPWELRLILPTQWPEGGRMLPAARPDPGLQALALEPRFPGRLGFFTLKGLQAAAQDFRPDLIYAEEEPYSFSCLQALKAAETQGVPLAFFSWENIGRRYKPFLNANKARIFRQSAGAVLGNAEAYALCESQGFRGLRALIPQYGVEAKEFKVSRRKGPLLAAYVGRLVWEKGVDLFIQACAQSGLPGLVIGQGPEEVALKALAAHLGAKIEFRPFVPFEARASLYHDFDFLVLPSRSTPKWKEQFGRVIVEAAASGLPSIGSRSGAIPEVIGEGGLIVPEEDSQSLAAAMASLAAHSVRRRELGKRARRRALKTYSEGHLVAELSRFWEQILER